MTNPDETTVTKAYSLYPRNVAAIERKAAREHKHRNSAALQAIIDEWEREHPEAKQ